MRTLRLIATGKLHRICHRAGDQVSLADGRRFVVFRATSCSASEGVADDDENMSLEVWFHLRFVPSHARVRRFLFERESILNTLLFAGFPGYMTKLWMVDPVTNDYAGLYSWSGRRNAERYATYITTLLGPLSTPGSVGHRLIELNGPAR